jgi:hypothetical protein
VTPVDDDLEKVLGTKQVLESRDEVPAPERVAGDDAQARRQNSHQVFPATREDCKPDARSFAMGL